MEERTYVARGGGGVGLLSWLALILSILALILAWTAYNRTGTDLEDRIQQEIREGTSTVEEGTNDAVNDTQDATNDASRGLDAGPDGVDEDDTDTQPTTPTQ